MKAPMYEMFLLSEVQMVRISPHIPDSHYVKLSILVALKHFACSWVLLLKLA